MTPLRGCDNQVEGVSRLHLDPRGVATASSVRGLQVRDHHAFVASLDGIGEGIRGLCGRRTNLSRHRHTFGEQLAHTVEPLGQGHVQQVLSVNVYQIEEKYLQWPSLR